MVRTAAVEWTRAAKVTVAKAVDGEAEITKLSKSLVAEAAVAAARRHQSLALARVVLSTAGEAAGRATASSSMLPPCPADGQTSEQTTRRQAVGPASLARMRWKARAAVMEGRGSPAALMQCAQVGKVAGAVEEETVMLLRMGPPAARSTRCGGRR